VTSFTKDFLTKLNVNISKDVSVVKDPDVIAIMQGITGEGFNTVSKFDKGEMGRGSGLTSA